MTLLYIFLGAVALFGLAFWLFWFNAPRGLEPAPEPEVFPRDEETLHTRKACPDCGCHIFHDGPSGGMAMNIKCANEECGTIWWYGPPFTPYRLNNHDARFGSLFDLRTMQPAVEQPGPWAGIGNPALRKVPARD